MVHEEAIDENEDNDDDEHSHYEMLAYVSVEANGIELDSLEQCIGISAAIFTRHEMVCHGGQPVEPH